MEDRAATLPPVRLSGVSQLYVTTVGAVSVLSLVADSSWWHVALVALALPLSLLALWVGFYGGTAVGYLVGDAPGELSWPVAVVWAAVWMATAWVNAQLLQRVLRAGWRTIAPRPFEDDEED